MDIYLKKINENIIMELVGSLDLYHASKLKSEIDKHLTNGAKDIILDLKDLDYIDSTGIGVFVSSNVNAKKFKKSLLLANVNEIIDQMLELTNLKIYFNIISSPEEHCVK